MRIVASGLLWLVAGVGFGQAPAVVKGHTLPVHAVAFSPDGKLLVSAGNHIKFNQTTGKIEEGRFEGKAWDVSASKEKFVFKGIVGSIFRLAVAADGKTFVTVGGDMNAFKMEGTTYIPPPGDVRIWDAATGAQKTVIPNLRGLVHAVAYSPDGKTLAFGTEGIVRLLDVATAKERTQLKGDTSQVGTIHALAYSGDGSLLASLGSDGVRLWGADGQMRHHIPNTGNSTPTTLALTADSKVLATSTFDIFAKDKSDRYVITLWDAATGKQLSQLRGHLGTVHSLAFIANGKTLVSASEDGFLKLWDVSDAKLRANLLEGECGAVYCVATSRDGRLLAAGCHDRTISIWQTAKLP